MYVTPHRIRTGPLSLHPATVYILRNVAPAVRGVTPGPGSVTVALASSVKQVVTLAVRVGRGARAAGRLDQDDGLGLGGAAAVATTVVVAGVAGAGRTAGGNIAGAGAADRAPSVGWRSSNQAVHKAGNVLELVTNGACYRLTQVATIVICWRPSIAGVTASTTAVPTVVHLVSPNPGQ